MVLGISLRRRKTKEEPLVIRPSPSLPNIAATGLPANDWPENLVDINTIKREVISDAGHPEENGRPSKGSSPGKATFHSPTSAIPSFHLPFRPSASQGEPRPTSDFTQGRKSIASMYSSGAPPSAFGHNYPSIPKAPSIRRIVRVPPKFNVMVAGGLGTGKTSFLKLLLETCDISPTAGEQDVSNVKKFTERAIKHTKALRSVSVEVCEERHDRIYLTVIDTVGFDFADGKEFELERGVQSVVKYLDTQFAETMGEESKVVRQNKGDNHIHLCIYLIDPDTIMRPALRRAKAKLPFNAQSQATLNRRASLSSITSSESSDSSSEEETEGQEVIVNGTITPPNEEDDDVPHKSRPANDERMAPSELQVLKRLATRCNILPVIARADTLTDERLALIRRVVRSDLEEIGLGFGVFDPEAPKRGVKLPLKSPKTPNRKVQVASPIPPPEASDEEESEEDRATRPVIKLRSPRTPLQPRDRSRSRHQLLDMEPEDVHPDSPPADGSSPPASWPKQSKGDIASMLPFTIIAPEEARKHGRKRSKSLPSSAQPSLSDPPTSPDPTKEVRRRPSFKGAKAYIRGPAELKGKFVRKYRWGTIDVIDPAHCDFVALRTAVLGTHMKSLKSNTKEVLYEKFRTEKLLARRATRNISEDDRKKLLTELGV